MLGRLQAGCFPSNAFLRAQYVSISYHHGATRAAQEDWPGMLQLLAAPGSLPREDAGVPGKPPDEDVGKDAWELSGVHRGLRVSELALAPSPAPSETAGHAPSRSSSPSCKGAGCISHPAHAADISAGDGWQCRGVQLQVGSASAAVW